MGYVSSFLLRDILIRNGQICPDRTALTEGSASVTYGQLRHRVDQVCGALWSLGVRPGARVAILMENNMEYIEILLALAHMGSIAVPLNTRLAAYELQYILEDSGSSLLVASHAYQQLAEDVWSKVDGIRQGLLVGSANRVDPFQSYQVVTSGAAIDNGKIPELTDDTTVILLYTSGTTGSPKGCMTTQRSWIANNFNMATAFAISAADRYLAVLPFFHVAGLGTLFAHLHAGGTVMPMAKYAPEGIAQMVQDHQITVAFLVPPMLQQLLGLSHRQRYDLSSLRLIIGGAGFEPAWVAEQVEDELHARFYGIYGQSESGNIVTAATRRDIVQRHTSYGHELSGFRVRIVDEADEEVPVQVPGELTLRGPSVMSGYWNREEATQEAMRGSWLHTGDIFCRHSDGTLEMIDRKKYLIKTGGENVYPAEVEHALITHPAVADVSVIGILDPAWGETVKACVVLRSGYTPDRSELASWCRERLAGYKTPRFIEFIEEIPRNHSGKPLKTLLEQRPTGPEQTV